MHSSILLTLCLFGIAYWVSGSPIATSLLDRGIMESQLLFSARETFRNFIDSQFCNNTRWSQALQDKDSYENKEVDYICAHLAFLDMIELEEVKSNLMSGENRYSSIGPLYATDEGYIPKTQKNLCAIWVREHASSVTYRRRGG